MAKNEHVELTAEDRGYSCSGIVGEDVCLACVHAVVVAYLDTLRLTGAMMWSNNS